MLVLAGGDRVGKKAVIDAVRAPLADRGAL
jgi:hypothetical protein